MHLCTSFTGFCRFRGTYCSQDVAIKVLKPERINTDMLKEFAQEVYIMRFVCTTEYNWCNFFPITEIFVSRMLSTFPPRICSLSSENGEGNFSNENLRHNFPFPVNNCWFCYVSNDNYNVGIKTVNLIVDTSSWYKLYYRFIIYWIGWASLPSCRQIKPLVLYTFGSFFLILLLLFELSVGKHTLSAPYKSWCSDYKRNFIMFSCTCAKLF